MSDAITTSRATCGPVDQRRPVGSFRVENGIPVFDGPDADMLRLRRAAGLLRRDRTSAELLMCVLDGTCPHPGRDPLEPRTAGSAAWDRI